MINRQGVHKTFPSWIFMILEGTIGLLIVMVLQIVLRCMMIHIKTIIIHLNTKVPS